LLIFESESPACAVYVFVLGAWRLSRFTRRAIRDQIRIRSVCHFDLIPKPYSSQPVTGLRAREEFVAVHVQVLEADLVLRHRICRCKQLARSLPKSREFTEYSRAVRSVPDGRGVCVQEDSFA
jgi:hypothetical protein